MFLWKISDSKIYSFKTIVMSFSVGKMGAFKKAHLGTKSFLRICRKNIYCFFDEKWLCVPWGKLRVSTYHQKSVFKLVLRVSSLPGMKNSFSHNVHLYIYQKLTCR